MTIIEAIALVDNLKPNTYTQDDKIRWLSKLDGVVKAEIIDTHEGGSEVSFRGYDENTPLETVLLVPAPYDDVYRFWLEAQIDYTNADFDKYNNSSMRYNAEYSAFERHYNRTHKPITHRLKFF